MIKSKSLQLLSVGHLKWVYQYWLCHIQNSLHQVDRYILQVYISQKQSNETYRLHSPYRKIGLDNMKSLVFPHCTARESHKSSYLLGPLGHSPCLPVWVESLDVVGICTGDKISSLPKYSATIVSWFLNRMSCLINDSPILRIWIRRKSLLLPLSITLCLTSK